ncbi:MAG: TraR/DksA C4-type zinc finger protein, partial [Chitinophagaceae bacterium]
VVAAKPEPPVQKAEPVKTGKPGHIDPKSLVSIKPKVQPVIKKEPPKASKVAIPKTTTKSSVKYEPEFTKSVLDASAVNYAANGPTMRYSDNDLQEFREIIQKKLDAAKKELNYLQGLITRKEEGGDMDEGRYMTMEDGSVSMEREQLSQMASRQITFIDHLEKAMMRIENKTYGICRVTGKLIDKARLRAVPHATLSIEAKQMMNK